MKKSYAEYFTALLLFGLNGIVASHIGLASYKIVYLRTGIGSVLLLAMFLLSGHRFTFQKHPKDFLFVLLSGIAMGAGWIFLYAAYAMIGVSISSLLYYCGPVIVMALSPLLFREKLYPKKVLCFLIVLAGLFLINGVSAGGKNLSGIIYGLLSAVMYAAMVTLNKKAVSIGGMENSLIQLTASFLTAMAYTAFHSGLAVEVHSSDIFWILLLGILNTGIGCFLYFSSIGKLPVQTVAVCGYLEPLSAVIFSVLLLGETMKALQWAGAACIIGGAVLSEAVGSRAG